MVTANTGGGEGIRADYTTDGKCNKYPQGVNTSNAGYTNPTNGRSETFEIVEPSYGVYFWKRTE